MSLQRIAEHACGPTGEPVNLQFLPKALTERSRQLIELTSLVFDRSQAPANFHAGSKTGPGGEYSAKCMTSREREFHRAWRKSN
jgi:hypothetical protein